MKKMTITTFKDSKVTWEETEDMSGEYILVDGVQTTRESRGQGQARECLRIALAEIKAAHPGLTIKLCANPLDATTTQSGLVLFYKSMGFRTCDEQGGEGVFMELN